MNWSLPRGKRKVLLSKLPVKASENSQPERMESQRSEQSAAQSTRCSTVSDSEAEMFPEGSLVEYRLLSRSMQKLQDGRLRRFAFVSYSPMVWSKFWLLLADDIHISSYFIYLQHFTTKESIEQRVLDESSCASNPSFRFGLQALRSEYQGEGRPFTHQARPAQRQRLPPGSSWV